MTTEIDAEGLAAAAGALERMYRGRNSQDEPFSQMASAAIRAYLSASRSTSDAKPVAWLHAWVGYVTGTEEVTVTARKPERRDNTVRIEPLYAKPLPTPASDDQVEAVTDEMVEAATCEFLFHRGERPYRILKGGAALWETYKLGIRAALLAAMGSTKR